MKRNRETFAAMVFLAFSWIAIFLGGLVYYVNEPATTTFTIAFAKDTRTIPYLSAFEDNNFETEVVITPYSPATCDVMVEVSPATTEVLEGLDRKPIHQSTFTFRAGKQAEMLEFLVDYIKARQLSESSSGDVPEILLTLKPPEGVELGKPATQRIILGGKPLVAELEVSQEEVTEGQHESVTVTAVLSHPVNEDLFVNLRLGENTTARSGAHFMLPRDLSFHFPKSELKSTLRIEIEDDEVSGGTKIIEVQLVASDKIKLGNPSKRQIKIVDDDMVTVRIDVIGKELDEAAAVGEAGRSVEVFARLLEPQRVAEPFSVSFRRVSPSAGDSSAGRRYAMPNQDYLLTSVGNKVHFPSGTTEVKVFDLEVKDDEQFEKEESIVYQFSSDHPAVQFRNETISVAIRDDEKLAVKSLRALDREGISLDDNDELTETKAESNSRVKFEVELNYPVVDPVRLSIDLTGTAEEGNDYDLDGEVIVINRDSRIGFVTLEVNDDLNVEKTETIGVVFRTTADVELPADIVSRYSFALLDNDARSVELSLAGGPLTEGGSAKLVAQLKGAARGPLTLPLMVVPSAEKGLAVSGKDFQLASSQLIVDQGEQSGEVLINTFDNRTVDGTRIVVLGSRAPTDIRIQGGTGLEYANDQIRFPLEDDDDWEGEAMVILLATTHLENRASEIGMRMKPIVGELGKWDRLIGNGIIIAQRPLKDDDPRWSVWTPDGKELPELPAGSVIPQSWNRDDVLNVAFDTYRAIAARAGAKKRKFILFVLWPETRHVKDIDFGGGRASLEAPPSRGKPGWQETYVYWIDGSNASEWLEEHFDDHGRVDSNNLDWPGVRYIEGGDIGGALGRVIVSLSEDGKN